MSRKLFAVPEGESTKHRAKPMRRNTSRIHAHLVYDVAEIWLFSMQRC
jgi:hypothetical protein